MFPPLLGVWVFAVLLGGVIAAGAVFLSTADYTRKESVSGWIVPETGAVRAASLRSGIVDSIFVSTGQYVQAGEPILSMRMSVETQAGDVFGAIEQALGEQLAATQRNAEASLERLNLEEARLKSLVVGRQQEQAAIQDQIIAQNDRLQTITTTAEWAQTNFEQGLITRASAQSWQEQQREAEQELLSLQRALRAIETEITDLTRQMERIPADRLIAISEQERAVAALNERSVQNDADGQYVLTSPISGRIEVIPLEQGQMLMQGGSGAVLTPAGDALVAELFVPSRAIGFIENGQEVRLKYDAFPFQRFGTGAAIIHDISRTILTPDEVSLAGIALQEPVFRIRAILESENIEAYGRSIDLRSGLTLMADVIVDERSLFEWLLDPLFAVGRS